MASNKKPKVTPKTPKQTFASVAFPAKRPQLQVAIFDVVIEGEKLLVNRLTGDAMRGYGETDVPTGDVAPLPKSIAEVIERCKYRTDDGKDGFPAGGVQSALRDGAVMLEDVKKAWVNRGILVLGDILPLKYKSITERTEDIGRNSGLTRAPRRVIRPQYNNWSMEFQVQLIMNEINPSQLYSILEVSGQCIGIGNWRPGTRAGGSFGRWTVTHFGQAKMPVRRVA